MFFDLLERDKEESLRCSTRTLSFPDNTSRTIETYRLIWRWYDHLVAYEYAPTHNEICAATLRLMKRENLSVSEALGKIVEKFVIATERLGGDLTDDDIEAVIAKRAASIRARRSG